ncbi:MAG TPA: metallopeptidase TldD-related protein [Thermoanaerobaculia bacterium]
MTAEPLREELSRRAPGQWELYRKTAESREIEASRSLRRAAWRREEGWAARWWEAGEPRFAAASSPRELLLALPEATRVPLHTEDPPDWPSGTATCSPAESVDPPPDLFEEVTRAVSANSHGEALLAELSLRRGRAEEQIVNGAGLDVAKNQTVLDGVALAVGRRGSRARETRIAFRWGSTPEIEPLARRLSDAATLPLSERPTPFASGQWLLDPSIAAALLAAISPIFSSDRPPIWAARGRLGAPGVSIADDASADAPFDGEGTRTRRILLVEDGALVGRLHDLRSAKRADARSTGHGVRASFRVPPTAGPRRLFFESQRPSSPAELLSAMTKGLFASALTAPVRIHLDRDRYEVEFTGISVVAGRAQGPVAGARASGRISELLRRIVRLSMDLQFFPMPFLVGSPSVLVERANFE